MELDDIAVVEFDQNDLDQAKKWAEFMDTKNQGRQTINLAASKNITGYLGHTAVENVFDQYGFAYQSTKTEVYQGGDHYDIAYEHDRIDVKANRYRFDDKYFFNEKMFVFNTHHRKDENYFCFVRVDPDFRCAWIYGLMHAKRFYDTGRQGQTPPRGEYGKPMDYTWVLSRELIPIGQYICRTYNIDRKL
jgi:hypothetical protein